MSDIADRVKKIVVEHLSVDEDKVIEGASFIDDLGADSLDTVFLVCVSAYMSLYVCLYVCSLCMLVCLVGCLSVSLSVCLSFCLSVCLRPGNRAKSLWKSLWISRFRATCTISFGNR